MSEAMEALERARSRADARYEATPRVDYQALNRMVKRQKGALTRAVNSGDPERVVKACRDAVREWDEPGAMWPDNWSRWQSALDDVLGYRQSVDIADLA